MTRRTALSLAGALPLLPKETRDARTAWFREHTRAALAETDREMSGPKPEPTTRDLPNAALAALILDGDAAKAERYLRATFSHQDMDPSSPGYGTIPWQVGHPEIKDANSIEFCIQAIGPIFKGYGAKLRPALREELKPHLAAAFTAIRRHNVRVTYTNIFLMKSVNLILAGEAFGDQQATADGYDLLGQWVAHTREAGIGEFDSPNYYCVNLNSLVMGWRYAARSGARERFASILYLFWTDIAANFFAPRGTLSGPHSRGYDFLGGHESVELYLYQEGLRTAPPSSGPSIGRVYLLENERPGGYRPKPETLAIARIPERVVLSRWRNEPDRDRYNWVTPDFAIGSTSGHYGTHDKLINIELAATPELPAIYIAPDTSDLPYGKTRYKDRSGHGKPVHAPLNALSVQEKGTLLVLLDLDPSTLGEIASFATNIVLPAGADRLVLDGETYRARSPFERAARNNSVVGVRAGRAGVAIRVFEADVAEPLLKADAQGLEYGAARFAVYHYRGAPKKIATDHVRAGILIEAARCTSDSAFNELLTRMRDARIESVTKDDTWSVSARLGTTVLEAARDLKSRAGIYRRVNGAVRPSHVLNVNGRELLELM